MKSYLCVFFLLTSLLNGQILSPILTGKKFVPPVSYSFGAYALGGPSGASTTTTGAVTVVASSILIAFCAGAGPNSTAWTIVSTPSNTWVPVPSIQQSGTLGGILGQMFYTLSPALGSTTASCTETVGPYGTQIAHLMTYVRSGVGSPVFDTYINGSLGSNASSVTSPTFSTTARDLVVVCGGLPDTGTSTMNIAGSPATLRSSASPGYNVVCGDSFFTSPQTGITAQVGYGGSESPWIITAAAFK